jgi:nitrile hydratase subunit beta
MARPHDIGGAEGYGPVEPSRDDPGFDHLWQARLHVIHRELIARGVYTTDEGRDGVERLSPLEYRALGYYERRLVTVRRMLVERGLLAPSDAVGGEAEARP